jgi:hypothetical protein
MANSESIEHCALRESCAGLARLRARKGPVITAGVRGGSVGRKEQHMGSNARRGHGTTGQGMAESCALQSRFFFICLPPRTQQSQTAFDQMVCRYRRPQAVLIDRATRHCTEKLRTPIAAKRHVAAPLPPPLLLSSSSG